MDGKGVNQKTKFLYGPVSSNFCARRSVMMANLAWTVKGLIKKLNFCMVPFLQIFAHGAACSVMMANLVWHGMAWQNCCCPYCRCQQNCCCPHCRCHHLGYSVPGVSPSRVLRAPGTSSYHLVPKHLRATWPGPE